MSFEVLPAPPAMRILVVDDDLRVRSLLADGLSGQGFTVSLAGDGESALRLLEAHPFDVVIIDLQMSPMSGWDLVNHLSQTGKEIVSIVLSGHVDIAGTVTALKAGVFDVLQKPVRLPELSSRIHAGLEAARQNGARLGGDDERRPSSRFRTKEGLVAGVKRLIGKSPQIRSVREQIQSLGRFSDVPVLIVGETGTGKEVAASALHDLSAPGSPFVSINCAAIPEHLFESELFGHEAGAFTGAKDAKAGLFELAGDGTVFLDEVAELPDQLQPKLLRVLQTRTFRRLGGKHEKPLLARVVSATNRKLSAAKQDGLRSDVYFRLAGFTIELPPLRERRGDVEVLALHFLTGFAERYPGLATRLTEEALNALESYPWPGNVRELQAAVEQAAMMSGTVIPLSAIHTALQQRHNEDWERLETTERGFPPSGEREEISGITATHADAAEAFALREGGSDSVNLIEMQRTITVEMFRQFGGNLSQTARALGIPRTTLRDRLKRYGEL